MKKSNNKNGVNNAKKNNQNAKKNDSVKDCD